MQLIIPMQGEYAARECGGKVMIRLGESQKLRVVKSVEFGVYLAEDSQSENRVLLPAKQVPQETELGSVPSIAT